MNDRELYQYKIVATKIICWSGVSAMVVAILPIIAILATFNYNMLWGGLMIGGVIAVQIAALFFVWFHKKQHQPVSIPLPPFVQKNQEELQAQVNELKEQVANLETMERVDRLIEKRKIEA